MTKNGLQNLNQSLILIVIFFLFWFFRGLQSDQEVLLTHGDSIDRVASNLKIIAKSGDLVAGTIIANFNSCKCLFSIYES